MRTREFARRVAGAAAVIVMTMIGALALCVLGTEDAFAIPSPELVVGSFVSLSQLFALASAVLGGGAAYATMRAKKRGGSAQMSRGLLYTAGGLFVVMCVSIGFNIWQYVTDANARQARLEATLTRPMPKSGGTALDPTAEGGQLRRAAAQSARHLDRAIWRSCWRPRPAASSQDTFLLDIRETAETEMGTMPGAKTVRFPDVKNSGIDFAGKTAIAFCHNGNRGYETCAALAAMGIDCRFLIGGLEKWLVEKRPLTGLNARTLADLRAVPTHRNQSVLLDTAAGSRAAREGERGVRRPPLSRRVRERPPAQRHQPADPADADRGAQGQDRRAAEAADRRALLRPPLAASSARCWGSSSTAPATTIAAATPRRGSIFTPGEPRPYIKEWLAEAHKGYFQKAAEWLAGVLTPVAAGIGLLLTIVLLAGLSRLFILPFAVKAERDQIKAREASAEMDDIKARFKDDPVGKSRAIRAFYQRHGMTPGRNLIAMGFLPIMAVALLAVQDLAASVHGSLPWIDSLAGRDPWLILPLVFGVLITAYLDLAFATSRIKRIAIWLIGLPALTATGALLAASADVYLITSATLLVIQRLCVSGIAARLLA